MNTQFTVKNFRNFDAEGATFELAPIIILTGCNSAGKSSVVKALMLLGDALRQVKSIDDLEGLRINFAEQGYKLGGFSQVLNNKADKDDVITFGFTNYSRLLGEEVRVTMKFRGTSDALNNGILDSIRFSKTDGTIIAEGAFNSNNRFALKVFIDSEIKKKILGGLFYLCKSSCETMIRFKSTQDIEIIQSYLDEMNMVADHFEDLDKYDAYFSTNKESIEQIAMKPDYGPLLRYLIEEDMLICIPILSELKGKCRSEVDSILRKRWCGRECYRKWVDEAIDHIMDNFDQSGESDFVNWIKQMETDYFANSGVVLEIGPRMYVKRNLIWPLNTEKSVGCLESGRDLIDENGDFLAEYIFNGNRYILSFMMYYYQLYGYQFLRPRFGDFSSSLCCYMEELLKDVLDIKSLEKVAYASTDKVNVKRLYVLDDKQDDLAQLIISYSQPDCKDEDETIDKRFVRRWLKKFGMGESIEFEGVKESIGVFPYIVKDNHKILLADEGYGVTQFVSLLLRIGKAIRESKPPYLNGQLPTMLNKMKEEDEKERKINKSLDSNKVALKQSLKSGYFMLPKHNHVTILPQTIFVEEPEIHLHPALQSLLADMFYEAYELFNIHFVVETHSEYLIRKSQVLVSKMGFKTNKDSDANSPFRTYYIPKEGKPYSLGYRKDGKFAERFGDGFYNESANLTNKML